MTNDEAPIDWTPELRTLYADAVEADRVYAPNADALWRCWAGAAGVDYPPGP